MSVEIKAIIVKEILLATIPNVFNAEKVDAIKPNFGSKEQGKLREVTPS